MAQVQLDLAVTAGGICNAVAFWFELHLHEETHISTSPYSEKVRLTHTPVPTAEMTTVYCQLSEKQIHLSV